MSSIDQAAKEPAEPAPAETDGDQEMPERVIAIWQTRCLGQARGHREEVDVTPAVLGAAADGELALTCLDGALLPVPRIQRPARSWRRCVRRPRGRPPAPRPRRAARSGRSARAGGRAEMAARVRLDWAAMDRLLRRPGGPVHNYIAELTRRTEARAKLNIRVRSGTTRAGITSSVRIRGTLVVGRVGTPSKVGYWLHEGTGIYGPRGRPIRPKRAQFLRFEVGGRVVYAWQVRGMVGDRWLVRALAASVPYPLTEH